MLFRNTCDELIINFTPTGMIPKKTATPHVPVSVEEIIEDVHAAYEKGITIAHLHARDPKTEDGIYHKNTYRDILEGVRKYAPDLIICVSLSGRNFKEFEKRSEPLELTGTAKPDMGSLTLSSLNFSRQASENSPEMVRNLAGKMLEKGVKPELEAFDSGMINYAYYLIKKGLVTAPYYFNLLLGNIASAQAELLHTGMLVRDLPDNSFWTLAGIGTTQLSMNAAAIAFGGGVRVGLEDNIYYDNAGKKLAKNIELIERIHKLAEIHQRPVMKPGTARKLLGLAEGNGNYGLSRDYEYKLHA